jgi:putative redox protein
MATITAELRAGTRVIMTARHFRWSADEPLGAGGTDVGPDPYELLLGSLAACTAITLRAYADFKGIAVTGVDVALEFDRIHAEDCKDCEDPVKGRIERIQSKVTIYGRFDEAKRERLAQVAERCPVHKTLQHGVHLSDQVAFEETPAT